MASRILGSHAAGGPFGKPLTQHTPAELDFILEMGARDEPERFTFLRNGVDPRRVASEAAAAWASVAIDNADRLKVAGLSEAQARLNAYKAKMGAAQTMKPGITRGGKPVNA